MTVLSIRDALARDLATELMAASPNEAGAFCLLREVTRGGVSRVMLGATLATRATWDEQQEQRLTPSGQMISEAVSAAEAAGAGLAFVHTHPMVDDAWLSHIDHVTSSRLARVFADLLDGPFASLVVTRARRWAGVLGASGGLGPLAIDVTGRHLRPQRRTSDRAADAELDDRQLRALGVMSQAALRELHVGVVGAGGLGAPAAETLTRMGVGRITLIDHDRLDTPSNARRVFGVGLSDVVRSDSAPAKADVVAAYLNGLGLGTEVISAVGDVRVPEVHGRLLECDVVINGTDTHSSRAALTELGVRAELALIDVGVRVGQRGEGQLDALRFERRIQVPEGPCLWCWGVLDPEQIRIESLPEQQRAQLQREGYIAGVAAGPAPSVAALTVTAAGAATSALLGMVAGALDVAPLAIGVDALSMESLPVGGDAPDPACMCRRWRAPGVGK